MLAIGRRRCVQFWTCFSAVPQARMLAVADGTAQLREVFVIA